MISENYFGQHQLLGFFQPHFGKSSTIQYVVPEKPNMTVSQIAVMFTFTELPKQKLSYHELVHIQTRQVHKNSVQKGMFRLIHLNCNFTPSLFSRKAQKCTIQSHKIVKHFMNIDILCL